MPGLHADRFLAGWNTAYDFYINYTTQQQEISVESGVDLVSGRPVGGTETIEPLGVMVCRVQL